MLHFVTPPLVPNMCKSPTSTMVSDGYLWVFKIWGFGGKGLSMIWPHHMTARKTWMFPSHPTSEVFQSGHSTLSLDWCPIFLGSTVLLHHQNHVSCIVTSTSCEQGQQPGLSIISLKMLLHPACYLPPTCHRTGWWENLQETPIFDGKNHGFL
jgi:hypothetical protein